MLVTLPTNFTGNVNYTDTTVVPGNQYTYRFTAMNAAGFSAYSNTANNLAFGFPRAFSIAMTGLLIKISGIIVQLKIG
ncbi:hypothetical protein [Sporotomaculum syntrophicum]|uniref:hypothetical protein n=1 Tax=Sporotomaculum syntrophicum TaxID=182264 RepID=UPI00137957F8|nr:hypothetical protein [Sporotomaculum syntrophicum]